MKRILRSLTVLLALVLALNCTALAHEYFYVGDTIPDFTVTDPDGQEYTLSKLLETHKAVLINFWFVDCPWCVVEFPYLEECYQQLGDDVAVLALTPYDSDEAITQFRSENALTFPLARDTVGLSNYFGVTGFPTTVMIDRFGVYCYNESGAQPSSDAFIAMCAPFIADDYTESKVNVAVPDVLPTVDMPASEDIAAAISPDSALTYAAGDPYTWPWIVGSDDTRSWAVTSNAGRDGTSAELVTTVEAKPGDALAFDFRISSEPVYDQLSLRVNGRTVKVFSGNFDWRSYAIPFAEAGTYEICFRYAKDVRDAAYDDAAMISNLRVLSGADAEAALAANPAVPNPLTDGDATIEPVSETARRIVFRDADGNALNGFGSVVLDSAHLTEDETGRFRVRVNADADPELAMILSSYDNSAAPVAHLEQDADGYYVTSGLNSRASTGYSFTLVYLTLDRQTTDAVVMMFRDAGDIDAFCAQGAVDSSGMLIEGVTWEYADEAAAETSAEVEHILLFTDAEGNPLAGVTANLCDETTCSVVVSDESGRAVFTGAPKAYDVHVLRAPEGFAADPSAAFLTSPQGGETVIVVEKAE